MRLFLPLLVLTAALLGLAPLRADVVIDRSPAGTLGSEGSHVITGANTTFTVTAGINLDTYNPASDDLLIGYQSTGNLTVTNGAAVFVPGTGSDPEIGGTQLGFAAGSSGTLTISAGGSLTTRYLQIGLDLGSTGTLLLTGANSALTLSDYAFWILSPTSSATITDGATLTSTVSTFTNAVNFGTLTMSGGGTLHTAGLLIDTSAAPTLYADAGQTDPGAYSATVLVTGAGSRVNSVGTIELLANSSADTVALTVTDSAALTTVDGNLVVGASTSFTASAGANVTLTGTLALSGTANLTGLGTTLTATAINLSAGSLTLADRAVGSTSGAMVIAQAGDGALTISGGATLASGGLLVGTAGDGYVTGYGGAVTVTGLGSAFTINGSPTQVTDSTGLLTVADRASFTTNQALSLSGNTTVSSGATLTSTYGGALLSYLSGETIVTGAGSAFATGTNTAIVGNSRLSVSDGGHFATAHNLQVGNNSGGTLLVSAGGTVDTVGAVVGYSPTFSATRVTQAGQATITGVDAVWRNVGTLTVGSYRHGDLTVSGGGVVENVGDIKLGSTSGSTAPVRATALVTGAGSALTTTGNLFVGSTLQSWTTGELTIADSARVTAASTVISSGDSLTLGGLGLLDTAALAVNAGGTLHAQDRAAFAFTLGAPSATAPLALGAGSTFTIDASASVYLLLRADPGFGAGSYALFSFDPAATVTGAGPATFIVATDFGGYAYSLDLAADALTLHVTAAPGAPAYEVAGLAQAAAVPEPATTIALLGLAALGWTALRRRSRSAAHPN